MTVEILVTADFVRSANAGQLHDEARGARKSWPASFVEKPDGSWVYRVDRDDVEEASVQGAVDAHVPVAPPDPDDEFRTAIEAATSIADLKAALLGTQGPGAEPRRPTGTD